MQPTDLICLLLSTIIAVVVFVAMFSIFGSPQKREDKIKNAAIRSGCIVTANRVAMDFRMPIREHSNSVYQHSHYVATYEYVINNKTYRTKHTFRSVPPKETRVYYMSNNPRERLFEGEVSVGIKWGAWAMIPLIIAAIAFWILKGIL